MPSPESFPSSSLPRHSDPAPGRARRRGEACGDFQGQPGEDEGDV